MNIQVCPICKGEKIQHRAWVEVNSRKVMDNIEEDEVWCPDCEKSVEPINKEE